MADFPFFFQVGSTFRCSNSTMPKSETCMIGRSSSPELTQDYRSERCKSQKGLGFQSSRLALMIIMFITPNRWIILIGMREAGEERLNLTAEIL